MEVKMGEPTQQVKDITKALVAVERIHRASGVAYRDLVLDSMALTYVFAFVDQMGSIEFAAKLANLMAGAPESPKRDWLKLKDSVKKQMSAIDPDPYSQCRAYIECYQKNLKVSVAADLVVGYTMSKEISPDDTVASLAGVALMDDPDIDLTEFAADVAERILVATKEKRAHLRISQGIAGEINAHENRRSPSGESVRNLQEAIRRVRKDSKRSASRPGSEKN